MGLSLGINEKTFISFISLVMFVLAQGKFVFGSSLYRFSSTSCDLRAGRRH